MLKFTLLQLQLAASSLSVYQDQFGQFEWKRNNFGNVDYVYKNGDKMLVSDEDSFGVIDKTGQWSYSKIVKKSQVVYDVEQNNRILQQNDEQNVIEVYNPWANTLERVLSVDMREDKNNKIIKFKLVKGILGILTNNNKLRTIRAGKTFIELIENAETLSLTSYGDKTQEDTQKFMVLYKFKGKKKTKDNGKLCVQLYDTDLQAGDKKCHKEIDNIESITEINGGFLVKAKNVYAIVSLKDIEIFKNNDFAWVRNIGNNAEYIMASRIGKDYEVFKVKQEITRIGTLSKELYDCDPTKNLSYKDSNAKEQGMICQKKHKNSMQMKDWYLTFISLDNNLDTDEVLTIINVPCRYIDNIWMFSDSQNGGHNFVIKGDDMSLNFFGTDTGDKNPLWTREEGLSRITGSHILNFSSDQKSTEVWRDYEGIVSESYFTLDSIMGAWLYRLKANIQFFKDFFDMLKDLTKKLNIDEIIKRLKGENLYNEQDLEFLDRYGIHKQIVVLTEKKCVYGINSLDGEIMWKSMLPLDAQIVSFKKMTKKHPETFYEQVEIVFDYSAGGYQKTIILEGKNGGMETVKQGLKKQQNKLISLPDESQISINLEENHLETTRDLSKLNFFKLTSSALKGFSYINKKFEEVWNLNFDKDEDILDYSYHLKGHTEFYKKAYAGFYIHIPEENKVIYKIVDSANVAVLTKFPSLESDGSKQKNVVNLNVYVVNTRSGRVLQQFTQGGVNSDHQIALTYDDNGIFISYFNDNQKYYELWAIEVFEEQIESNFISMINKFALRTVKNREVDYYNENGNFVLQDQKFGLPYGIKTFKPVQTKAGLTRRNLIAITTDDQVISIDRYLISTRRPFPVVEAPIKKKKKKSQEPVEEEITYQSTFLPIYDYMIPYNSKSVLNANYLLYNLKDQNIAETDFESTAVVFTYGKDMFWCKVMPDKMFDMLNDDFNYILLLVIVLIVTVGVFAMKKYASMKESKRRYIG